MFSQGNLAALDEISAADYINHEPSSLPEAGGLGGLRMVVGDGPIGCELVQTFARLDTKITIVQGVVWPTSPISLETPFRLLNT